MVLLQQQVKDPVWNRTLGPYWRSLPPHGAIYTKEIFAEDHLRLLQDPQLVRKTVFYSFIETRMQAQSQTNSARQADYARLHQNWTREVYVGPPGLQRALGGAHVPLDEFVHATALVRGSPNCIASLLTLPPTYFAASAPPTSQGQAPDHITNHTG